MDGVEKGENGKVGVWVYDLGRDVLMYAEKGGIGTRSSKVDKTIHQKGFRNHTFTFSSLRRSFPLLIRHDRLLLVITRIHRVRRPLHHTVTIHFTRKISVFCGEKREVRRRMKDGEK